MWKGEKIQIHQSDDDDDDGVSSDNCDDYGSGNCDCDDNVFSGNCDIVAGHNYDDNVVSVMEGQF